MNVDTWIAFGTLIAAAVTELSAGLATLNGKFEGLDNKVEAHRDETRQQSAIHTARIDRLYELIVGSHHTSET